MKKILLLICVGLALAQVGRAQNGAEVLSVDAPASVALGATFTATITMTNTGGTAWTAATAHALGSESPRNNAIWTVTRVTLPADPIDPGSIAAFTTTFTAPSAPGIYNFAWSMVQDGVEWFGQIASRTIKVGNGQFTPGDLVVNQMVPTAVDPAPEGATPVFNTAGTAQVLKNISLPSGAVTFEVALPITGPDAMVSGANPFTGMIDLSTDGKYIVVGGYSTNAPYRPFGGNVSVEAAGSPVPRAIGTVGSNGQYILRATTTPPTGFTGGTFRGVVSDGAGNYWGGAQNSGIYYFGTNFAPVQISPAGLGAIRNMNMVNGRPYFSTSQYPTSGNFGLAAFTSVAPTSPEEPVLVLDSGNATTGASGTANPKGFCVNTNLTIAYVVDLRASPNGGIYRYNGTGTGLAGSWTYAYTISNDLFANGGAFQDIVADFSGTNPRIYATAGAIATGGAAGTNLVTAVDAGAGTATFTLLATAPPGTTFRGLTFAPKAAASVPVVMSISKSGSDIMISWTGSGTLQSASTVTGPYTPVSGTPTNPYTTTPSGTNQFYRVSVP